ncbi:MAG: hypothetical protein FJ403_17555 [Verrucomicrobia bacterium]|nr:hypothetical protein [Verrucomicrobiota bacterium]
MDENLISPGVLLLLYSVLILVASLAGGWIPLFVRLTHTRMQVATSFVAGLMLGVGLLHLLPHAWFELRSIDRTAWCLLAGFLVMFFIQRFFHFHHHDVPEEAPEGDQPHTLADKSAGHLSWSGAALGLTLHTLIDGIALAASVKAETQADGVELLAGFETFLVVILHKPFDAMAIGTLMAAGGWSKQSRHLVNSAFALAIPVGVALFHLGANAYGGSADVFLGGALAFAAGTFLCTAASDLLPELQFHAHDRGKLSVALIAGLLLAAVIGKFETRGHDHAERTGTTKTEAHDNDKHDGHDHNGDKAEPKPVP